MDGGPGAPAPTTRNPMLLVLLKGATSVAQHNRMPLIARIGRLPPGVRTKRTLIPVAVTVLLVMTAATFFGFAHLRQSSAAAGANGTPAVLVARADLHVEMQYHGKDLELNVAITQTGNDCQAPLKGGVCLRYSVVLDEQPLMAGYGVIPASAVKVTRTTIVLNVDTSKVPEFVNVVGTGTRIVVNWKTAAAGASLKSNAPLKAAVQGNIAQYTFPSNGVVATMIYR